MLKPMRIIGVMSGTSLDGLDLICADFYADEFNQVQWKSMAVKFVPYTPFWRNELQYAHQKKGIDLHHLHTQYGTFLGRQVHDFIQQNGLTDIDAIASHGHTVFHQPEKGFTLQIGSGAHIHSVVDLPVVTDFRTQDVALGGQGAPLVPIGDKRLFSDYDACVNLGGFANISFDDENGERRAFDICPVNFVLNHYAQKLGHLYDENGHLAQQGKVNATLLKALNEMPYYQKEYPKSLGREWVEKELFPLLEAHGSPTEDTLCTFTHHVVVQIKAILARFSFERVLFSGGGTFNTYLMDQVKTQNPARIHVAEKNIIEYKEALIFALLGFLRLNNQINVLKSVTGAKRDSCSGVVYK